MTTPRPDPRLGTELGPYRIEAVIGRGGMGVVYLAEQARLGRKVALKIVSPEFSDDPKARARFLRESQMAAAIDHPNILPIYEADEADGVLFIAMRLVEGTDLAARLAAGPMEPRAAAAILVQVAGALDAAHARGLVHRDVKPANILLSVGAGADQGDHAYLTDFGLTKRGGSETSLTAAGGFAGTLAYIAPEQVDGREIDGRADQYSLACMAFECLTGTGALRARDGYRHRHGPHQGPAALGARPAAHVAGRRRCRPCAGHGQGTRRSLPELRRLPGRPARRARADRRLGGAGRTRVRAATPVVPLDYCGRDHRGALRRRRGLGGGGHGGTARSRPQSIDEHRICDRRVQPDGGRLPERS